MGMKFALSVANIFFLFLSLSTDFLSFLFELVYFSGYTEERVERKIEEEKKEVGEYDIDYPFLSFSTDFYFYYFFLFEFNKRIDR